MSPQPESPQPKGPNEKFVSSETTNIYMIAINDNSTQTDEPSHPTPTTNDDLKIKWISDASSSNPQTESDEEPTKNATEANIDKIQKADTAGHNITFKECLVILYNYMTEYASDMQETLTLMILYHIKWLDRSDSGSYS